MHILGLTILLCGLGLAAIVLAYLLPRDGLRMYSGASLALTVVGGAILVVGVVLGANIMGQRAAGRISCRKFGEASGYTTRFRVVGPGDGGTCLVETSSGRWIPRDNLQQIVIRRDH